MSKAISEKLGIKPIKRKAGKTGYHGAEYQYCDSSEVEKVEKQRDALLDDMIELLIESLNRYENEYDIRTHTKTAEQYYHVEIKLIEQITKLPWAEVKRRVEG